MKQEKHFMVQQMLDKQTRQNGYVTLIGALIVGVIATAIGIFLMDSSLSASRSSFTRERSLRAQSLADACTEIALEEVRKDQSFTGNDTVGFGSDSCEYDVDNGGGSTKDIYATGTVATVAKTVFVTVNYSAFPMVVTTWTEG